MKRRQPTQVKIFVIHKYRNCDSGTNERMSTMRHVPEYRQYYLIDNENNFNN